jgi:DNA (cytosine-5)-methyltransferase 1
MFQSDLIDYAYHHSKESNNRPADLTGYKFIDLFAGIGGIRIPFTELGAECVFSSEWDKHAQQTYYMNHGHLPNGDITEIEAENIPSFDILLAGFPCQPFSNAGHKKGFEDTRGTLFFDVCRIADYHKPKVMLLENVKGFKGHNKGQTFAIVSETLKNLGYTSYSKVLNARDFGLPQNRERIFIVCFLDAYFHKNENFNFPVPSLVKTKVENVLDDIVDEKYTLSDRLWTGHQRRKAEHKMKGNGFGYSLFSKSSPYTSTISARYYKDGSEILIEQENKNPRKLTPREAARLQGFPENFVLPKSEVQAYKQFGNSVPVPVVRAIASHISSSLSSIKVRKNEA